MFEAYSQSKKCVVNVSSEFNLKEVFNCPNPQCDAQFKIKSATGKKAKHFAKLRNSQHIEGCPYEQYKNDFLNSPDLIKYSLDDIFNDFKNPKTECANSENQKYKSNSDNNFGNKFIRTPKQLYSFCISNDLNTPYCEGLTVGDVILDSRNLLQNKNYEGITGYRIVVAQTVKYDNHTQTVNLKLSQRTKNNKTVTLNISVKMYDKLLAELRNYIFDTYDRFSGNYIVIFGNWKIDSKYNISCIIENKKHLIFKLKTLK